MNARLSSHRIVLTGGPGAGKTTAADLFRREIGEKIVIVPEAATLLFSGGFPRLTEKSAVKATQRSIYAVQRNLEDVNRSLYPRRTLLCDRGTVDGAIYWPDGPEDFFNSLDTSLEAELNRYDTVIFFESAALGGGSIEGGNPVRNETIEQAIQLDRALKKIWSYHRDFHFIPNNQSFFKKITLAMNVLEAVFKSR